MPLHSRWEAFYYGIGLKVYERLVANGVPAVFVPMAKDFKDMTVAERRELEETYA